MPCGSYATSSGLLLALRHVVAGGDSGRVIEEAAVEKTLTSMDFASAKYDVADAFAADEEALSGQGLDRRAADRPADGRAGANVAGGCPHGTG